MNIPTTQRQSELTHKLLYAPIWLFWHGGFPIYILYQMIRSKGKFRDWRDWVGFALCMEAVFGLIPLFFVLLVVAAIWSPLPVIIYYATSVLLVKILD